MPSLAYWKRQKSGQLGPLRQFRALIAVSLAVISFFLPQAVRAEPSSMWRREWPTFSPVEGAATVAAGAGTLALLMVEPPQEARWQGGILFDDALRRRLRLGSEDDRQRIRAWGDLPYYAAPAIPLLVDPLIAAWLVRGDRKAAFNLAAVGLEAFSYAGLASFLSTRISRRERPDSLECRYRRPRDACKVDTESFYSGHTTIAAAAAGIVCANHRVMPLWGNRLADAGACALATTGAVASGVSRLMSDRHYATDVVAGFGFGFGLGYAVPTLLHYARDETAVSLAVVPSSLCTGACLRVSGSF